jgi:hypothetical protein
VPDKRRNQTSKVLLHISGNATNHLTDIQIRALAEFKNGQNKKIVMAVQTTFTCRDGLPLPLLM